MRITYTKELLEEAVKNSVSYAGILRFLGIKQAGGTQCHIKKMVLRYEIDTSHFTGQGHNKGRPSRNKKSYIEILVNSPREHRQDGFRLTRALLESGRLYICEGCGNDGHWKDKKLTLDVDHIDGNWENNTKENLRFMCPNCHHTTDNFGTKKLKKSREIKRKIQKICV